MANQKGPAALIDEALAEDLGDKCLMRIMDPDQGDSRIMWDPKDPDSLATARDSFDACRKRGMVAYRVDKAGGRASVMNAFDPEARAIIFAAPLAGG